MAFVHGSKAKIYMNGYDLSSFLRSVSLSGSVDTAETSTFGNTFKTYVPGMTDYSVSMGGIYDGATDAVDAVFGAAIAGVGDDILVFFVQGDGVGNPGYGASVVTSSYEVSAEIGDVSQVSLEGSGNSSIDRVKSLTNGLAVSAGAFQGTSIDDTAATTNGAVLYVVQTASAAGATYTLQDSADNTTFATVSGATFALGSGRSAGRVAVSGTLRRYVHVISSAASTFVAAYSRK